jgi:hypothetical protein
LSSGGTARGVDEDEAVPLLGGKLDEPVLLGLEGVPLVEARRFAQRTVEAIRPRMVGAHDDVQVAGLTAGQQLVAAVPACVGEAAQPTVLGACEERARFPDRLGALVTDVGHVLTARHAHPPAPEEMALFPVEHGLVDVGRARQEPTVAERSKGGLEAFCGERRSTPLTDHKSGYVQAASPSEERTLRGANRTALSPQRRKWRRS